MSTSGLIDFSGAQPFSLTLGGGSIDVVSSPAVTGSAALRFNFSAGTFLFANATSIMSFDAGATAGDFSVVSLVRLNGAARVPRLRITGEGGDEWISLEGSFTNYMALEYWSDGGDVLYEYLDTTSVPAQSADVWYWMRVRRTGSTVGGSIWEYGTADPGDQLSGDTFNFGGFDTIILGINRLSSNDAFFYADQVGWDGEIASGYNGVRARHSGTWKPADPYARHNGVWKPATNVFARDSGVWKDAFS